MALADMIGTELTGHSFSACMRFHARGDLSNAEALVITERIAGRTLTAGEQTGLLDLSTAIVAGDFTVDDLEKVQVLVETDDITNAQAKTFLGL